jgi:hypothetical protein
MRSPANDFGESIRVCEAASRRSFARMRASRAGVTQLAECLLPKRSVTFLEG